MFDPSNERFYKFPRQSGFRRNEFYDGPSFKITPEVLVFTVSAVIGVLLLAGVLI